MWAKLSILYSHKSLVCAVTLVSGAFVVVGFYESLEKWVKSSFAYWCPVSQGMTSHTLVSPVFSNFVT